MLYAPAIFIDLIFKMKIIILKCFQKSIFNEDIEFYCSNSDDEYSDEECINSVLEILKSNNLFQPAALQVLS